MGDSVTAGLISLVVVLVLAAIILVRSAGTVPPEHAGVVERLGRYLRTQGPGRTLLIPVVDRMRSPIDLREQVVSFPPRPVATADDLTVVIEAVVCLQVTDPRAASYEIQNYLQAVEQLTATTLRTVVGSLKLNQAVSGRDGIRSQLHAVLDGATGAWGVRIAWVEINPIDRPQQAGTTAHRTVLDSSVRSMNSIDSMKENR